MTEQPTTPNLRFSLADAIPPQYIAGNLEVRRTCARLVLGRRVKNGITRTRLQQWRERQGFPDPLYTPLAGVELWDIRAVRYWCKRYREVRRSRGES